MLVIVDEHPVLRAGLRQLLENESDIVVLGEAETVDEAVAFCQRNRPDVVLFDVDDGSLGTVDGMRRLRDECAGSALVAFGRGDDDEDVFRAVVGGADGHVGEHAQPRELVETVRLAASGGEPIRDTLAARPALARRVLEAYARMLSHGARARAPALSDRELRILELAAAGMTNQQIGHRLGLSEHAVKTAISHVLARHNLRHRTEAVVYALRNGWIPGPVSRPADAEIRTGRGNVR